MGYLSRAIEILMEIIDNDKSKPDNILSIIYKVTKLLE